MSQSQLGHILLSLSQSLNAAFNILNEMNCRLASMQESGISKQQDLDAVITLHRSSTLETIRALKNAGSAGSAFNLESKPGCQSISNPRIEQLIAAEVARNQDDVNDEIQRLKSQVRNIHVDVPPEQKGDVDNLEKLRERVEHAFSMLDKKADVFELEKKANL